MIILGNIEHLYAIGSVPDQFHLSPSTDLDPHWLTRHPEGRERSQGQREIYEAPELVTTSSWNRRLPPDRQYPYS